jgi:hypothetical protein
MKSIPIIIIACFAFGSVMARQQALPNYGDNPEAGRYYNHDGVNVYYEIYGQGKPMVLLHGNGGSIGSRAQLIPEFASHYRVIALDARCHGKTDCPKGYLTYEQMASDVNAVLLCLHLGAERWWYCWLDAGHTLSTESKKAVGLRCQLTPRHNRHRSRTHTYFGCDVAEGKKR